MIKNLRELLIRAKRLESPDIPPTEISNLVTDLQQIVDSYKPRKKSRSISLAKLEAVLYRESGCVDPSDVPLLMKVLFDEAGITPPKRLEKEIRDRHKTEWVS